MKSIKRTVIAAAAALLAMTACTDRSTVLKIYNWGDYIDEDLLNEFEDWYFEQTGEEVHTVYQTFDINETMLSRIEKGQEDYDLACPSDYIIERMLRADLLLPIERDFGDTPDYITENLSPFIISSFGKIEAGDKNVMDYAVPYMWGTTGILYNAAYVDDEEATTWDIIRNPKFEDKIFMKDAPRDVYSPLLIFLKQKELQEGSVTMEELMYDCSDESIALVEKYLKDVKQYVAGWEADFGKEQMTQEKGYVNFTWSGDAMWAVVEGKDVGVDLRYQIPKEGSNVWFDGWVIPKYAKNVKAARYFLDFMCRPDNAIRNMDVTGYVGSIASPEVLETMIDDSLEGTVDASYFFGEEGKDVKLNPLFYPDASDIDRCTLMHDWGDDTEKLIEMWSRVKGDNASLRTYFVIFVTLAALIGYKVGTKVQKSRRKKQRRLYTK